MNDFYLIHVHPNDDTAYHLTGANINISGDNVPVNISVGDTIKFEVNVIGNPFWIKTTKTTGSNNAVTNPPATNNGVETGIITWTPNTPGTYYYISENHADMYGEITVS